MERDLKLEELIMSVPSYKDLKKYSYMDIRAALHFLALYGLPTKELISFFKHFTYFGESVEIAAGAGLISRELGIRATDLFVQKLPEVKLLYKTIQQPLITYGDHVKKMHGERTIEKYEPTVVFSSWVTPKFNDQDEYRNAYGMIEERVVNKVEFYIQVCGEVHYDKPIMNLPHVKIHAPWIMGRSKNDNYICIFCKDLVLLSSKLDAIDMDFEITLCNYQDVAV